ncbi:glutathione synthase [Kluyveromyces lactis]|uniref:Glutathione synthetase n=1 Tax=Kluyveromyces lactis (strain ATCC 8585 / CBS 2359 / DSM 70799 / NBRC 1267 / NRRL Y-1140 / WM37) TaxID=284590 RepID=Q6CKW7_KLULA|nr:uncharacterized protein KLLA0_F07557g [Kluyveromyces lactis]CAG98130.1 KLLA0F07557p [Kluyveromyces lactis]|eukprot:XP_455422.1 uncharacterized protein KLLA0_F07557g [Kluyveromyces lactis]
MSSTESYPKFPAISTKKLQDGLQSEIFRWALTNGLAMYPPNFKPELATVAPITLFPTPLPNEAFQKAIDVQTIYNALYASISQNKNDWLAKETEKLAKSDPEFTGRLWTLYKRAKEYGIVQDLALGVFRSDYLINSDNNQIKQVEFNTVSVSFGGLSTKVGELHDYLNKSGNYSDNGEVFYDQDIPISPSAELLATGLATAINKYQPADKNKRPIVAFIVQNGERNVFDQSILALNLLSKYDTKSVRLTIHEIHEATRLDPETKRLYHKTTGQEIGLVYFRSGYAPSDFVSEQDWENRLTLEISYAIKAPNLLTQLSGTKKIQQLLTDPKILKEFLSDTESLDHLLPTFVKIYPLDSSVLGEIGKKLALTEPENYVLKPQREGGGNNIYKEDIPGFLESVDEDEWSAYILMELITPKSTEENFVIRGQELFNVPILSELGIFGTILFDHNNIYSNEYAGWLLRSKFSSSNEGGVAAGFGCVDSVVLY